jgi:hypothetical protein
VDARKDRALDVFGAGGTQNEAALAAGVARTTVWRWLQDPAFVEERRRREDRADAARAEIFDCLALAGQGLRASLTSADDRVRFQACKYVFETILRLSKQLELPDRIVLAALADAAEVRHGAEAMRLVKEVSS